MRTISALNMGALESKTIVVRDFIWIEARDRTTGDPVTDGYWSDAGTKICEVINPLTGNAVARTFYGAGGLISADDVPATLGIKVETVRIVISGLHDRVQDLVRGYDCKQGRIEMFSGYFNTSTHALIAPAMCKFVGFIDDIKINTPTEGNEGGVEVICTSHTAEMSRINSETRSNASQFRRSATDNFFQDAPTMHEKEFFWGTKNGKVPTSGGGFPKLPIGPVDPRETR